MTYQTILDEARLYTTFFNKTIEFNENLKKSLNLKFLKFTSDEYGSALENLQFEAQNYRFLDIVEIKFIYSIYNKSGEEIHFGEGSSNTVAKGSNVKFEIDGYNPFAGEISNVVNMDMESLTFGIYIEEISFQDGSTLSRPQLE